MKSPILFFLVSVILVFSCSTKKDIIYFQDSTDSVPKEIKFDNYLILRKNNKKVVVDNDFKDFLTIIQFSRIVAILIKRNISGIFNVSISEKIYLSDILKWIDKKFYKKIEFTNYRKDSFTLSNKKLLKKIEKKPLKSELVKFCKNIFN